MHLHDIPFPPPPFPGTDGILPLSSYADLEREGELQKNCVAGMSSGVRSGLRYFYRVTAPSRATVLIAAAPDGRWRIAEIKGPSNHAVPPGTRKMVERWLDEAQRA